MIGPGEATLRAGAMLGQAIGMTVPGDESVAHHQKQVADLGLTGRVLGLEPINRPIGAYGQQDPAAMTDALTAAAVRLAERGADVILPVGACLHPDAGVGPEVFRRIGLPSPEPGPAGRPRGRNPGRGARGGPWQAYRAWPQAGRKEQR